MADSINDKVLGGAEIVGVMGQELRSGVSKNDKKWAHFGVDVNGSTETFCAFGQRGIDICEGFLNKTVKFVKNGRFVNPEEFHGEAPQKEPIEPKKEYKQTPKKDNRSFALSYAKDMCTAGIIDKGAVLSWADTFNKYLNTLDDGPTPADTSDDSAQSDSWMDKGTSEDTYPDGRKYGTCDMTATKVQAEELLGALRVHCKDGRGEPSISMAIDVLNGLLCKFYFNDLNPCLDIKGDVSGITLRKAIMELDGPTVEYFIKELNK